MRVLITGADGFIGKNLQIRLSELQKYEISTFTQDSSADTLNEQINSADFIFHLAGANRPNDVSEFKLTNTDFTIQIGEAIKNSGRQIPIVFSSSTQATLNNPYGESKANAEKYLLALYNNTQNPVFIYRLTNIFGKWSRPNYNSVVATFCYNTANNIPIEINNPATELTLIYIDDLIDSFLTLLENHSQINHNYLSVEKEYKITVGSLATTIQEFKNSTTSGITLPVGTGLIRALYSTYLSFLPTHEFAYTLIAHSDNRGKFVEMLKTPDCGQFSFFTAHPGITRGGHYHHSKTEKFLVISGTALYRFRHVLTNEYFELIVSSNDSKVVETIPGWSHDITNIGNDELIVMLWANEIFNPNKPDTIAFKVE